MTEIIRLPTSNMCPYPQCKAVAWVKAPKARAEFCEIHATQLCKMAEIGLCASYVMPRSGWCKRHNAEVLRFDFIHGIRHTQAMQQAQAQAQLQAVSNKLSRDNGSGKIEIAKR